MIDLQFPRVIYIYLFFPFFNKGNLSWTPQVIQGPKSNGRFGFTIAALGDVNMDGINGKNSASKMKSITLINLKKISSLPTYTRNIAAMRGIL